MDEKYLSSSVYLQPSFYFCSLFCFVENHLIMKYTLYNQKLNFFALLFRVVPDAQRYQEIEAK